ncbi:uncharacterized protein LOC112504579 [Cynara cardunculus var. scolymus]|uniref:uncharacterized protein LOC112504579 n=1 Tax=Cynara cardunculus var. scolymus TaxID=59895 RepID=UPI000D630515|nr:uncharacterized protein LOC112504579 [Cynara cardunculus var. scolymus]
MDEQGTKIQANVLQKWVPKFRIPDNNGKAKTRMQCNIVYFIQAKSLIVLATVKAFRKDVPWFYMGCTRCNRKVRPMYNITDKDDGSGMKEESESFDCTTDRCRSKKTEVLPKFGISLRVQDDTGIVSLSLFDREANKVLNQTTTELYEKVKESGDLDMFPDDLDVLLDRSCFIYGISKLTYDDAILNELEMRCASQQDDVSFTGENATTSDVDKSTADNPELEEKLCDRRLRKVVDRKQLFESWYDADQDGKGSAIKTLKIPKVEKYYSCF